MFSHTMTGGFGPSGAATFQTFWPLPVLYYFAQGGFALSGLYRPTAWAAGGPSLSGVASVGVSYRYLAYSPLAFSGVGFAKLVTPARPRFRAVPTDETTRNVGLPGHCLVYSREGVRAREWNRGAAAYLPKHLLAGRTIVARADVKDPKTLPADAVVVDEC